MALTLAPLAAAAGPTTLDVELNDAVTVEGACRLIFTVENGLGQDIERLVYETVLFDREGGVRLLTLFDFMDAPAGRLRVRQFDVPGVSCDELGLLLVNGVAECEAPEPVACDEATRLTTRTGIEVRQ